MALGGTQLTATVRLNAIRIMFAQDGTPTVHIDYALLSGKTRIGGDTHTLQNVGPAQTDPFTTDGTTTAWTTKAAPYGGTDPTITLNGQPVTSGVTWTTNANGTMTVTFATAPAASTSSQPNGQFTYPIGPSLTNAAGDLVSVLGLSDQSQGTIFQDAGKTISTSHKDISELSSLVVGWAKARVIADKLTAQ